MLVYTLLHVVVLLTNSTCYLFITNLDSKHWEPYVEKKYKFIIFLNFEILKFCFCKTVYRDKANPVLPTELWLMILKKLPRFTDIANVIMAKKCFILFEDASKIFMLYVC